MKGFSVALQGFIELNDVICTKMKAQVQETAEILARPHDARERDASFARWWATSLGIGPSVVMELVGAMGVLAEGPVEWYEHVAPINAQDQQLFSQIELADNLFYIVYDPDNPDDPENQRWIIDARKVIIRQPDPSQIVLTIPTTSGPGVVSPVDILTDPATNNPISTGVINFNPL